MGAEVRGEGNGSSGEVTGGIKIIYINIFIYAKYESPGGKPAETLYFVISI